MIRSVITGCALLCSTTLASAATFTFNLTGPTAYAPSFAIGTPAPGLTVESNRVSNDTNTVTATPNVARYSIGMGMIAGGESTHTVDGLNGNDMLELTFGSAVRILSATFSYAGVGYSGATDGFDFYADDSDLGTSLAGDRVFSHMDIGADSSGNGTYNFVGGSIFSTVFGFAASWESTATTCIRYRYGVCREWSTKTYFDSFKLKSVTVELKPPDGGVPTVPVPAALPLLATGLGALGFAGWRRGRRA